MLLIPFPIFSVRGNGISFAVFDRIPATRDQDCVPVPEICRPQRTSNQSNEFDGLHAYFSQFPLLTPTPRCGWVSRQRLGDNQNGPLPKLYNVF